MENRASKEGCLTFPPQNYYIESNIVPDVPKLWRKAELTLWTSMVDPESWINLRQPSTTAPLYILLSQR